MLAAGAVVGLVGGIAAQVWIGHTLEGELADLARISFALPVTIFIAWWLVLPGMSLERGEPEPLQHDAPPVKDRIELIEAAFEVDAVRRSARPPAARVDHAAQGMFQRSIRRAHATTQADVDLFGVRRVAASAPRPVEPRHTELG